MINHQMNVPRRGFTLIEILIALAVAGALVAVAVPMYRDYVIKTVVTDALAVAEEARAGVELALAEGRDVSKELQSLVSKSKLASSGEINLTWNLKPEAIVVSANIPMEGTKAVLALERNAGNWQCVKADGYVKAAEQALSDKALPSACKNAATAAAAPAPQCPADQETVSLPSGPACTPKCPSGQERDKANPTQCKAIVCGPNEEMIPDRGCLTIPPKPKCDAGSDAFRGYSNNNDPTWSCMTACPPGQMPGKAFKCIPDPNAKPAAAAAPAPAAAKPAAPALRPGEDKVASIKCRSCMAGLEDLCEALHEEITCTAPNNWCITFVDNHADGSKTVSRGCGNFDRVWKEWYLGTSDDDKCRERLNSKTTYEFNCTFGCGADNCNDNLLPAEDTLYTAK